MIILSSDDSAESPGLATEPSADRATQVLSLALGVSLVLSGTLCVIGETLSFTEMYDRIDVEAAEWIKAHTPPDAVFATTSEGTHLRPVRA